MTSRSRSTKSTPTRTVFRILLGAALVTAGIGHLTFQRQEFRAQVPPILPLDPDFVVLASGVAEIGLGTALIALPGKKSQVGKIVATFFTLVFPGNISQLLTKTDAFHLNSDRARAIRLLFQPVLVLWSLWSTSPAKAKR
jgi:uncharacterized membrane protein